MTVHTTKVNIKDVAAYRKIDGMMISRRDIFVDHAWAGIYCLQLERKALLSWL